MGDDERLTDSGIAIEINQFPAIGDELTMSLVLTVPVALVTGQGV